MELTRYLRARNWPVAAGYLLFSSMMAIGYCYNVTFVQLGLKDLGERVLGLDASSVAWLMALLALLTCGAALLVGQVLQRRGPLTLLRKLQLALLVVAVQSVLTAVAPSVDSTAGFTLWIVACSAALGLGVPVTFSLTVDLIPVRDRGYVAAAITAVAYFVATVYFPSWEIDALAHRMLAIMLPGALGLALIVLAATSGRTFLARWVRELSGNAQRARFGHGRFVTTSDGRPDRRFWGFVALMFGIFFIDSLGFLRIVDTPVLIEGAWQAPDSTPRLIIGATHIVTALLAGILYTKLSERHLFYWIFGIFALTHLSYSFRIWLLPETTVRALGVPMLYATAVSLYTVVNFAIWADFSTPRSISRNAALGVALSGWTATFVSTALAIRWQTGGMALITHLRVVNALALLFFLTMLIVLLWPRPRPQRATDPRKESL